MSKRQTSSFGCKNCGQRFPISFNKPSLVSPARFIAACGECGTEYTMTIKVRPGTNSTEFDAEGKFKRREN